VSFSKGSVDSCSQAKNKDKMAIPKMIFLNMEIPFNESLIYFFFLLAKKFSKKHKITLNGSTKQ
jgi:hypothetical protein